MDLKAMLLKNFFASSIDKIIQIISQFLHLLLMARLLTAEDYGMWGVALSLFVFIHFINIAAESILYRHHRQLGDEESHYLSALIYFALVKLVVFCSFAIVLFFAFLDYSERGFAFLWPLLSMAIIMGGESLYAVYQTYFVVKLRQDLCAKITLLRSLFSLSLILGLFIAPTLSYMFCKELILLGFSVFLYHYYFRKEYSHHSLSFSFSSVRRLLVDIRAYSLWVHLIGVTTNFIYKADIYFLSLFSPIALVGKYTISLNGANFANILPGIIGQQASVAFGHLDQDEQAMEYAHFFIRLSALVSFLTLFAFVLFGRWYLTLITGEQSLDSMYFYLLCIVGGLVVVKSFASPLVAYLNIKGSVVDLFWRVNFPLLVLSALSYYFAAKWWQDRGVAWANIVNSLFWVFLLFLEVNRIGFKWKGLCSFATEVRWLRNKGWIK